MRPLPLRVRLAAWYFLVLCLAFGAFSLLAFFEVRGSIHSAVDEGLRDRAADIKELLERQWPAEQVKSELAAGSSVRGEDDILEIAETRGEWAYSSVSALHYGLQLVRPGKPGGKFEFSTIYSKGMPLRILNGQLRVAEKAYDVQIAAPMDDFYDAVNRFRLLLLFSVPVLLLVASAGGYWLGRKALAPVGEIARAAQSISEHELSKRLPILQTGDELQSLSETLNEMFGRLERAFKRVTQFTADASHELRTPVALMRTRTEIALRKERSEADYRETIVRIHQELERTSALIENLMTLARADSGSETLQVASTNLNELLLEISEPARLLAQGKSIHYEQRLPETPVHVNHACPGQLQRKELNDVPVLHGRLIGAEAVYANRQTKAGYVPATLARKRGSRSSWVTLLTAEQLETMDGSEGRPNVYVLAEIPTTQFVVGHSEVTPLYTYVDIRGRVMTINGKPVSLRSTRQKRAKSMLPTALAEDATKWLDFEGIPSPNPPSKCSQILRRFATSKHPNR